MEEARRALDISRDEYALCSYVLYRQASSRATVPGWCCDPKDSVADFVGVSRPGLYKMIDRMEAKGLMETNPANGVIRTTAVFMDAENGCKQSLHFEKTDCKQSLHSTVNKVYTPGAKSVNKVTPIYRNKEDNISKSKYDIVADAPTENQTVFSVEIFEPSKKEILTLETENTKKKKAPAARRAKLPTPAGNDSGAAYLHSIGQTPTLQPYQSEPTGDPVDLATEWMQVNAEQVKIWQERAGTQFDNKRLKEEAVKYFAYYQAKHGPDHMANTRPMYFFQRSFGGWLMSAKHYNTPFSTGTPKKQAVNDARGIDYSRPQKF